MNSYKPFKNPLYITKPSVPDIEKFIVLAKQMWGKGLFTNNGPMVRRLEKKLSDFLDVPCLSLFSSGTAALDTACKVLDLEGEVITTPFTFAATINSLALNNLMPVFCDIDEDTMNINPEKIEELITSETSAILAVHVFGNPCKVDQIKYIAGKYGLKVIYDAAHAFGVKAWGTPIGCFGDVSMFSFHATKIYHTIEGGALALRYKKDKIAADLLKNFGLEPDGDVKKPGMNYKMNEMEAAMGILLLEDVNSEIARRRKLTWLYREMLDQTPGLWINNDIKGVERNYSYLIIRIKEKEFGLSRDDLFEKLMEYNIFARRYFYPLCSNFSCYRNMMSASTERLPVAEKVSKEVLALPLYGELKEHAVEKVCGIIKFIARK